MPGERSIYKPWLRYRYDDLSKKSADLEQELADAMTNHEKELNSIQNEHCLIKTLLWWIVYLTNEITALQHMCETKTAENGKVDCFKWLLEKIHKELESLRSQLPATLSGDESAIHQQMEYIDKKLQTTLRRVLEIKEESESIVWV